MIQTQTANWSPPAMPITQDRMLRLLQAGEAYRMSVTNLAVTVEAQDQLLLAGDTTPSQAYQQLRKQILSINATPAAIVMAEERVLFNQTYHHNDYQKHRQELRRRMAGVKPQKRRQEMDLTQGPSLLLGPAANAARMMAQIDATDDLTAEDLTDLSQPDPNMPEDVRTAMEANRKTRETKI